MRDILGVSLRMANVIDCMHLGRDRVIGAWEVRPGVIVDPGPASCSTRSWPASKPSPARCS